MQFIQSDTSAIILRGDSISDSLAISPIDSALTRPEAYASLFSSEIGEEEMAEKPLLSPNQPDWVALVLVMGFILLAWGRLFFRRRLEMIFRGVFAKNYANQLVREGNLFNERIGLILFLVYLATISMFVFQALPLYNVHLITPPGLTYTYIFGFFLGLWFLKAFMVKVLSLLFNTNENSRNLLTNMYLFNLFAGIILLPAVTCMAYANLEVFYYISLVIIASIYTLRIIREAIIGFTIIKFSVFHLILYLCTLEILPLIVLAKILTRNMIL
jgi:hypothetical protein